MNDLDKYLEENNITFIHDNSPYTHPHFINQDKLFDALNDIIDYDQRVMVFGDCDIDGLMCALQFGALFKRFGHNRFKLWNYKKREHSIDQECVYECINQGYKYCIILDVGVNDMATINKLATFGVIPIVIDHHMPDYQYSDYHPNAIIINPKMDNIVKEDCDYKLSAGALTFCLLYKFGSLHRVDLKPLSAYGLISLYTDCMDMSSLLNKQIYNMATSLPVSSLPYFVKSVLGRSVFRRRFIEFTFAPKINASFRSERLDLINSYFMDLEADYVSRKQALDEITSVYEKRRELTNEVTDMVKRQLLDNFVFTDIGTAGIPVVGSKLYNDTGIIANNLATEYGKPCIALCDNGREIKGSFRDTLGRNYLPLFKQICKCGGHPSAFGMHISYKELDSFLSVLKNLIDTKFAIESVEDNLVIKCNTSTPDMQLVRDVAYYNEFSGGTLPIAVLEKRNLFKEVSSYKNSSYYKYKWGDRIVESRHKLVTGAYIKIKPVISSDIRLITYVRGV